MVKDIRKYMGFTQEEMAVYLDLSVDMIRSMERGRRQLPFKSQEPAAAMLKAIHLCKKSGPADDPTSASDHQLQLAERLLRRCGHRLDQYTFKLKAMQKAHVNACFNLGVCQLLMQALPTQTEDDLARLKWTQDKAEETLQCIKDNNSVAQIVVIARLAGMRSMIQALEAFLNTSVDRSD